MATPTLPRAFVVTPGGDQVVTAGGDRVVAITDPSQAHDRVPITLLELQTDRCALTFGVGACTATGTKCYNTLATCKLRTAYAPAVKSWQFVGRGQPAPAGEPWRPYIERVSIAPTEIKPQNGLAIRGQTTVTLADETDSDYEGDPYRSERTPAGTFWGRFTARNPNAINRTARIRRGWWGDPYQASWFSDETYIVERIAGPDRSGQVTITLVDPIKLLDKAQVPAPTSGKLAAKLVTLTLSGTLADASDTTATLPPGALPDVDAYVGQEIEITTNLGNGQRRTITAYDPATRLVTVPAWDQRPNNGSTFAIRPLSATLGTGEGAQYAGASHVRIGKEIIALSSVDGDVLRWSSSASRGAFGSAIEDEQDEGGAVQRCEVWQNARAIDVLTDLLTAGGVTARDVDGWEAIQSTWLGAANITACISAPAKASDLFKSLAMDLAVYAWWSPGDAQVKLGINLPAGPGDVPALTDDNIIAGSGAVERVDAERITQAAVFYGPRDSTEDGKEARQFLRGEVAVDLDAESQREYRDTRPDTRFSPWLTAPNQIHVSALVARRLAALRDAPVRLSIALDPKDAAPLGDLVDITTRDYQGADGAPQLVRALITKVSERGDRTEVVAQSTPFGGQRWAFIAPDGQADYDSATADEKQYAYIAPTGADFADGLGPYRII